jgi:hypothetical protein
LTGETPRRERVLKAGNDLTAMRLELIPSVILACKHLSIEQGGQNLITPGFTFWHPPVKRMIFEHGRYCIKSRSGKFESKLSGLV